MPGPPIADRLFVALDVARADVARPLVTQLGDDVRAYKVGLELVCSGEGLQLARALKSAGKHVFLDMKLLDIGHTVERATASVAALGLDYLTVHGTDRKTLDAAVRGRAGAGLKLLAVTVLTSLDRADLAEQGIAAGPSEVVMARARRAADAGFDGVIASGHEASAIRAVTGPEFLIVTPGIRPAGGEAGDQARVTTPAAALRAGASHIVVGRPITAAADPAAAARAILAEMASAQ